MVTKNKQSVTSSEAKVKFRKSSFFNETFEKHRASVAEKLKAFMATKSDDPMAKYGAKDSHFTGNGPYGLIGVLHAHLTHDISVIYRRSGKNPTYIDLLAILSHDELGTGQPPNIKKQKTMAKKLDTMTTESVIPGTYPAFTSGTTAIMNYNGKPITIEFENGVRGINIPDTITITNEGIAKSIVITGEGRVVV